MGPSVVSSERSFIEKLCGCSFSRYQISAWVFCQWEFWDVALQLQFEKLIFFLQSLDLLFSKYIDPKPLYGKQTIWMFYKFNKFLLLIDKRLKQVLLWYFYCDFSSIHPLFLFLQIPVEHIWDFIFEFAIPAVFFALFSLFFEGLLGKTSRSYCPWSTCCHTTSVQSPINAPGCS